MKTFLRRLEILNFLRLRNIHIGSDEILQHLIDASYLDPSTSKAKSQFRLIQRDLEFLLGDEIEQDEFDNDFGLSIASGQGKSKLWRLEPFQQLNYDFEKMPAFMALALSVSQKHLKQVLPSSTQVELKRIFLNAEEKLHKSERKLSAIHYKRLSNSVEFFQRGQRLQAPSFDVTILDTIYHAILKGKRISFSYQTKGSLKEYDLHPYGVAILLPKLYLIGKKQDANNASTDDFRSFLVHKISDITLSRFDNKVPESFQLKQYLDSGNMDVLLDHQDPYEYLLVLQINIPSNSNLISDIQESPISSEQNFEQINETSWQLTAKVKRTIQLKNWILSLGRQAVVISPKEVRMDILNELESIRENYT